MFQHQLQKDTAAGDRRREEEVLPVAPDAGWSEKTEERNPHAHSRLVPDAEEEHELPRSDTRTGIEVASAFESFILGIFLFCFSPTLQI